MKLSEIVRELDATILYGEDQLDKEIILCGASDLMSDVLVRPTNGILLMTGLASVQAVRTAQIAGVLAVVFVRNKRPGAEVIEAAKAGGFRCSLHHIPCSSPAGGCMPAGSAGWTGDDKPVVCLAAPPADFDTPHASPQSYE